MKTPHLRRVLILSCHLFVGSLAYLAAADDLGTNAVESSVDQLLNARGKVSWSPMVERIASFGNQAVPVLTNRLANAREWTQMRFCIIVCLCRIDTDVSLKPVRDILQNSSRDEELVTANQFPHASSISLWCQDLTRSIQDYPTNREAEVLPYLIRLSDPAFQGTVSYYATERLREMIRRQPSVAGVIIASLDDNQNREQFSWNLGDILAMESGHYAKWGVFGPSNPQTLVAQRNSIWRDWWKRNKNRSIAEWMEDAKVVSATIPIVYAATNSSGRN